MNKEKIKALVIKGVTAATVLVLVLLVIIVLLIHPLPPLARVIIAAVLVVIYMAVYVQAKRRFTVLMGDASSVSPLTAAPEDPAANKALIKKRIMSKSIVLYGNPKDCERVYKKYYKKLKIRRVMSDENKKQTFTVDGKTVTIEAHNFMKLGINDYVIICMPTKARLDNRYRQAKKLMKYTGRAVLWDFARDDVAEMLIEDKKLIVWFGYCQVEPLQDNIFSHVDSIRKEYVSVSYRYEINTLKKNYKYDECLELLKLCDVIVYLPLLIKKDKIDFEFEEYAPKNVKYVSHSRMTFKGYYPYRDTEGEVFHKYPMDSKKHWPFGYSEKLLDDMLATGMTDDEIYAEIMRDDFISEKEILKNLRWSYKYIEISEKSADIKMLDFIKENVTKQLLYRDGWHYTNVLYFELARRIAAHLGLDCADEINELERKVKEKGTHFINFTEVPILPCVAKTLGLEFVTDETLWRVRTTYAGAWNGTAITVKLMTRKEWIYSYLEYTRAAMTISRYRNLLEN